MDNSRSEVIEQLRLHHLRPSEQRIAIYAYLREHRIHPNADTIFQALSSTYPTLSLTTVYNTLKSLEQHGLAQSLTIENGELRFDADTSFHAHFKCRVCQNVYDFFSSQFDKGIPKPDASFTVESVHLDFYGICPHCGGK